MSLKFRIKTLGCKVNQSESAMIAAGLKELGFTESGRDESTELVVINTCTVTARSDYESRQLIRRALREDPGARIVVTGCYAETAAGDLGSIEGIDRIVPNQQKLNIKQYINKEGISNCNNGLYAFTAPVPLKERSRAFLKIQDGCDNRCTYCAVWRARGASRSVGLAEVVSAVRTLEETGLAEVVLAGVHVGFWGKDTGEGDLPLLLRKLLAETSRIRFRISSIEPGEVGAELDRLLANEERICRHLHIPLQAADDSVLARMGRGYSVESYFLLLERLRDRVPGLCLGTDIIAGFPGESDDVFERGLERMESSSLAYMHVFPYSRRRGTLAADLPEQVPGQKIKIRARRLRDLSAVLRERFYISQDGRDLHVVYEGTSRNRRTIKCISDNYVRFDVPVEMCRGNAEDLVRYEWRPEGPHEADTSEH